MSGEVGDEGVGNERECSVQAFHGEVVKMKGLDRIFFVEVECFVF